MKISKGLLYKIMLCAGITLIILYTFLPIMHFNEKKLYKNITEVASPLISSIFEADLEDMVEEFISYSGSEAGLDEIEELLRSLTAFGIYSGDGAIFDEMREEEQEVWIFVSALGKAAGILLFYLPVGVLVICAGVLLSGRSKKNNKLLFGIVAYDLLSILTSKMIVWIGINKIINIAVTEAEASMGMSGILDGVLTTSFLTFVTALLGIILCAVSTTLIVFGDSIFIKTAVLEFTEGELKGAKIALSDGKPVIIGRDGTMAQIVVASDTKVSRKHCQIEYSKEKKAAYITDFSTNGTTVGNGEKLLKDQKTQVPPESIVGLSSNTKFKIKY